MSSLAIDVMDESIAGEYVCSGPSSFQTIVLNVQQRGVYNNAHLHGLSFSCSYSYFFFHLGPTPSPITFTESSGPSQCVTVGNSIVDVIIGVATGGVVIIIVIVIIIIIVPRPPSC